jgi:hypothetical protein
MSNMNTTGFNSMRQSKIPIQNMPDGIHPKHPFRDKDTHQSLMEFLKERLALGKTKRDGNLDRYVRIDKSVSGWLKLTPEDRVRARKQDQSGIPQAVMQNLPITMIQLDDMMTYFAQVFAPSRGMFFAKGKPDEQTPAEGITTLMNNHALHDGYYREVILTLLTILKYNLGGFHGFWDKQIGPRLLVSESGSDKPQIATDDVVWQGNRLRALDMYNTLYDPSVHPTNLYKDGEWGAVVELVSHYWLQREAAKGRFFNTREALQRESGITDNCVYYKSPPAEARMESSEATGATNWVAVLSETPSGFTGQGFEKVTMYCWLNPVEMNLVPNNPAARATRNTYELWRFTIINDTWIIEAEHQDNAHAHIPLYFGLINDDNMGPIARSPAEVLKPLQDFASFAMNTHIQATRKNIWGLTVYDPSVVDLSEIPDGEVAARVPLKPTGWGQDINKAIWEHSKVLDTKQTMQDIESIMGLVSQFFPASSMPNQVASLDRAVDSQVAAVVQGSTRRMQKGAMLLDHTMFRPIRTAFYFNIVQKYDREVVTTDFQGRTITVDLGKLKETDLPYIIGQGLKAIDLQAAADKLQMIIFAIIQNPPVAQQLDLLGLIDYWTSMMDVDVDMTQFRLAKTPEGTAAGIGAPAGEGAAAAAAADGAIQQPQAIRDPSAVTQPLAG